MANTTYAVGAAESVKLWSKALFHEVKKQTWMDKFIGKGGSSLIQEKDETKKTAGDRVRTTLRMQLSGDGVAGDGALATNEEALSTYTDDLLLDQLRHAVRSDGRMTDQRVAFSVRQEAMMGLADWWSTRLDVSILNQLAGNTGQADLKYTGNNATVAPDAAHWVFANAAANEGALAAGDEFTLADIDKCVEKAKVLTPAIRPVKYKGEDYYVMFIHPYQEYDLRTNTNTGQWLDIQKAAMQGGKNGDTENPIFNGALGVYNGVILHCSNWVPSVAANTRRAVFAGAQAGIIGYGRDDANPSVGTKNSKDGQLSWVEESFDYGNQLGVSAGMIYGAKKSLFNSADFGTIVLSSFAVAH